MIEAHDVGLCFAPFVAGQAGSRFATPKLEIEFWTYWGEYLLVVIFPLVWHRNRG